MDKENLKKILTKANSLDQGNPIGLAKEFLALDDKIESSKNEIIESIEKDEKPEVQKIELSGISVITLKGDKGDKPTNEELLEIIEPLIPEPIKGDDGKDYILTQKDKKEIASSIKVPIVEKIIETVIEKPIITNEIKEVAVTDPGEIIVEKINELEIEPDKQIDFKHIKNAPEFRNGNFYGGSGIKEIVAGTNISVDNSNPGYPVVTALNDVTATWGSISGDIANQTDLTSNFLKLDQTTPQTTVGTFTFPKVVATTDLTTPLIVGGSAVGSKITYKSTTGVGTTTGIAHQWTGGTDGGTVIATMLNDGKVGIGITNPSNLLHVSKNQDSPTQIQVSNSQNTANSRSSVMVGVAGDAITMSRYLSNYSAVLGWANRGVISTDSGLTAGFLFRTAAGPISFQPAGNIDRMVIDASGNVGIGTTAPGEKLEVSGNIQLTTDGNLLKMGTGEDMTIQYTGTNGRIDTSIVAPSDLIIDCGTDKTIVLEETVYVDIDFPIIIRTTGVGQPTLTAFNGNILMPEWEVNDFNMCESQEFIHGWKEGSEVSWHIHMTTNGTNVDARYVKFELEYAYSVDGVWTFPAVFTTADLLIPANTPDKKQMIMSITAFTPTGSKIGDHMLARLKRVASTGTAPTGNPWIPMLQVHVQCDTIGSRQISTK